MMITLEDIDKLFPPFDGKIWEPGRKWMEDSRQKTLDRFKRQGEITKVMPCLTGPHLMTSSTTPNQPQSTQSLSDSQATHPIIWVVFQGKRFGPYLDAKAARKEGFVIDETPLDEIQYGGWPVKWPEIPKVNC